MDAAAAAASRTVAQVVLAVADTSGRAAAWAADALAPVAGSVAQAMSPAADAVRRRLASLTDAQARALAVGAAAVGVGGLALLVRARGAFVRSFVCSHVRSAVAVVGDARPLIITTRVGRARGPDAVRYLSSGRTYLDHKPRRTT